MFQAKKNRTIFLISCLMVLSSQSIAVVGNDNQRIDLDVALSQPILMAGQNNKAYIKIALTGFDIGENLHRPPVNLSIVLDKSGSMQGQKMLHAKQAAIMAVERLSSNDMVSIVTYDDEANVVWPATRATEKRSIIQAIRRINASGSTALYDGVSKGAEELGKYLESQNVNRVILLSDGLANVGPSTPHELGRLGISLAKQGISVTTIGLGLGYNEDLMTDLAGYSDGNHSFAENAWDLARIFDRELENALSVVANEAVITIQCQNGVQPLRVIGRDANISGRTVTTTIGQLYRAQEKFLLLEVEIPAGKKDTEQSIASVDVTYHDIYQGRTKNLAATANARFTASKESVDNNTNHEVMISAVEQVAVEQNREAIQLRDEGKVLEAQSVMSRVGRFLKDNAKRYRSDKLEQQAQEVEVDAERLDDADWNANRKKLKEKDYQRSRQSYQ